MEFFNFFNLRIIFTFIFIIIFLYTNFGLKETPVQNSIRFPFPLEEKLGNSVLDFLGPGFKILLDSAFDH